MVPTDDVQISSTMVLQKALYRYPVLWSLQTTLYRYPVPWSYRWHCTDIRHRYQVHADGIIKIFRHGYHGIYRWHYKDFQAPVPWYIQMAL